MSNLNDLNFRLTLADVQKLSKEEQDGLRFRCQTDLRFLVNCILRPANSKKFPPLLEKVHGKIIDAFLRPDPRVDSGEWDTRDEFVIMASRGMLKSTIGAAFITQCILCAPDIRILIMSGKLDKAESILAIARKPFFSNQVIRFLFPEWAIEEEDVLQKQFTCPKRNPELDLRDPTLSLASFDSVKAGGHYELILLDDATNEINSSNQENCEKTHGTYDDTDELIEPEGYRVFLGTKWHEEDLPAYIVRKGIDEKEKSGDETVGYFVLPAWTLRTDGTPKELEARNLREKNGTLMVEDVFLTWPEKLNAKFLFRRYRKNRADFYKQYLLDASLEDTPKSFSQEILNRQITSLNDLAQIPYHDRSVVVHWDLASAFTGRRPKSQTDYSCGVIAVFQNSTMKMWIAQVVLAHFNGSLDYANAIVSLYRSAEYFGPVVGHSIEDAMGARHLEDQINDVVRKTAKPHDKPFRSITWELPNNELNAKNIRISVLASAMKTGHVYILSNVGYLDDVRSQFEKWTIDAKRRKDDAPDCIAQVWQYYRPLIFSRDIENLTPNGPILLWEPELPQEAPDPHAGEGESTDMDALNATNFVNLYRG